MSTVVVERPQPSAAAAPWLEWWPWGQRGAQCPAPLARASWGGFRTGSGRPGRARGSRFPDRAGWWDWCTGAAFPRRPSWYPRSRAAGLRKGHMRGSLKNQPGLGSVTKVHTHMLRYHTPRSTQRQVPPYLRGGSVNYRKYIINIYLEFLGHVLHK